MKTEKCTLPDGTESGLLVIEKDDFSKDFQTIRTAADEARAMFQDDDGASLLFVIRLPWDEENGCSIISEPDLKRVVAILDDEAIR